jgi:hypothetical protein
MKVILNIKIVKLHQSSKAKLVMVREHQQDQQQPLLEQIVEEAEDQMLRCKETLGQAVDKVVLETDSSKNDSSIE